MLLSRALNRGYGMTRYRWPMHFGLLNNDCLWVIDETQLMGPGLWTSGQLDWMRNQRFGVMKPCRTWWMSATNSPVFLDTPDRRKHPLELRPPLEIGEDPKPLSRLNPTRPLSFWKGPAPKAKKNGSPVPTFDEALAAEILAEHSPGTLSLVVCNSVKAAQQLYRLASDQNAVLLTSRFRRNDRGKRFQRRGGFSMAAVAFAQPVEKSRLPAFPPVPNNGLKLRREAGAMCDWSSVFHFDYGDDWFFLVTCTAVKESSAKRPFKKIVTTCGTAPEQYPEFDE